MRFDLSGRHFRFILPCTVGICVLLGVTLLLTRADRAVARQSAPLNAIYPVGHDFDGDGVDDLLVSYPIYNPDEYTVSHIRVYTGATRDLLFVVRAALPNDGFGFSSSSAGDVNNDGYDDIIVGTPLHFGDGFAIGRAHVFSGADGQQLLQLDGSTDPAGNMTLNFGRSVAGIGDIDSDGSEDVAVGMFRQTAEGPLGVVQLFSGATGEIIGEIDDALPGTGFGLTVAGLGDIDLDGTVDLAISAPEEDNGDGTKGKVFLFLGSTDPQASPYTRAASEADAIITNTLSNTTSYGNLIYLASNLNNDSREEILIGSASVDDVTGENTATYEVINTATLLVINSLVANNKKLNADSDNDGDVDLDDLVLTISALGQEADSLSPVTTDVDGDGDVDADDAIAVVYDFGLTHPLKTLTHEESGSGLRYFSEGLEEDFYGNGPVFVQPTVEINRIAIFEDPEPQPKTIILSGVAPVPFTRGIPFVPCTNGNGILGGLVFAPPFLDPCVGGGGDPVVPNPDAIGPGGNGGNGGHTGPDAGPDENGCKQPDVFNDTAITVCIGGAPPVAGNTIEAIVTIGDASTSSSESWAMTIGNTTFTSEIGSVLTQKIILCPDTCYDIRVSWVDSCFVIPDYDYLARIELIDDDNTLSVCVFDINDPDLLMGYNIKVDPLVTETKIATLCIFKATGLAGDSNSDGGIDIDEEGEDDVVEDIVGAPGILLMRNTDDDDDDGVIDSAYAPETTDGTTSPDNDLVEVKIIAPKESDFTEPGGSGVTWQIEHSPNIRVWRSPARAASGLFTSLGDPKPLSDIPGAFYVEGMAKSSDLGDASLTLTLTYGNHGGVSCSDTVRLTVCDIVAYDIRAWSPRLSAEDDLFLDNDNLDSSPGAPIDGAVADGTSIVLLRLEPKLPRNNEFDISVVKEEDNSENDHTIVGTIWRALRPDQGEEWNITLPLVPMTTLDPMIYQLSSGNGYQDGIAYYVPPDTYADPIFNEGEGLNSFQTSELCIRLSVGGDLRGERLFTLTRPPILFAHGLYSDPTTWSAFGIWDQANFKTQRTLLNYSDPSPNLLPFNVRGYDAIYHKIPEAIDQILISYRSGLNGKKYAISKIDYVGHSMGSLIARLYVSDVNTTGHPRKQGHLPIVVPRTGDLAYRNANNLYAGAFRRLVTIGGPFDGSGLAVPGEFVEKAKRFPDNTLNGLPKARKQIAKAADKGYAFLQRALQPAGVGGIIVPGAAPSLAEIVAAEAEELWEEIISGAYDYSVFPDALVDLQPGSSIQLLMDAATYPSGRFNLPWHPIAGVAGEQLPANSPFRQRVFGGIFVVSQRLADLVGPGYRAAVDELDGQNGDLVVSKSSQLNGGPDEEGTVFQNTIHSSNSGPVFDVPKTPENGHPDIAALIYELLSKRYDPSDWKGDLKR